MVSIIPLVNFSTERAGCYNNNGSYYRDLAMFTENGFRCIDWDDVPAHVFNISDYQDAGEWTRNGKLSDSLDMDTPIHVTCTQTHTANLKMDTCTRCNWHTDTYI